METKKPEAFALPLFLLSPQVAEGSPPPFAASPRAAQALVCQSSKASREKEGEGAGGEEARSSLAADEEVEDAKNDVDFKVELLSPSSSSPSLSSLGIDSRALSTAASTLSIRSPRSLMNLKAAALKACQSEEGEDDDADAAIERCRGGGDWGLRVAGALRGAAIDRKGTSTRKDDVGFIFSGEIDGARKRKRVKLFFWLSPWSFQVEKKKQEIIIG